MRYRSSGVSVAEGAGFAAALPAGAGLAAGDAAFSAGAFLTGVFFSAAGSAAFAAAGVFAGFAAAVFLTTVFFVDIALVVLDLLETASLFLMAGLGAIAFFVAGFNFFSVMSISSKIPG
ncbi:MAG: hypothetical protein OEV26_00295 [Gallionella sp.]|nr:hypothetical protein [Gallionella sp.]MDH4285849.1 hypothetical protein [Gallionella sp.]